MNLLDLSGRTALVTGAAQGFGAAISNMLAAHGARVIGWDLKVAQNEAFRGNRLEQVDVATSSSLNRATRALLMEEPKLDILVNNAGVQGHISPIDQQSDQTWERVLAINLTAVFRLCRTFAPHMQSHGYGRIINIASVAGLRGVADAAAYSAAKGGVIALSKALAKEVVGSGVTVNCVAPGLADTPMQKQMEPSYLERISRSLPMGRPCRADEVAATVTWIASPSCTYTTGAVFDVSGGRLTA
ncbi:SDR family NAD(P)-dependent oxidoreductase [Variovorax ureilyticus]|uniref:SDR family NAD(P)-dependent oxidoreductase n=1 Tax=Variovorax ureilyticus TaxID=1836198 RepID=UPI003D67B280